MVEAARRVPLLLLLALTCAPLVRSGHILHPEDEKACKNRWRTKCIPWTIMPSEFWEKEKEVMEYLLESVENINKRLAKTEDGVQLVKVDYDQAGKYDYIIRVRPTRTRDEKTGKVKWRGCSTSDLGRGSPRDVRISSVNCSNKHTALHEMLHAMGLAHEHQRDDRNEYDDIHFEAIASLPFPTINNYLMNKDVLSYGWTKCKPHGPYDRISALMYSDKSKDGKVFWSPKLWRFVNHYGPLAATEMSEGDAAALEAVLKPCTAFPELDEWEDLGACPRSPAAAIGAGVAGAVGLGAAGMYVKRRSDQNKQVRETKRAEKRAAQRQHRVGGDAAGSTGSRSSRKAERLGSVSRGSVGSRSRSKGRRSTAGSIGTRRSSTKA